MVSKGSGEIVVTNDDKNVRGVSTDGTVTALIDTAPFDSKGVCLAESGQVVVCMRGQKEKNHVAIYSPDGKDVVREIRGKDAKGKQWITDPYMLVQNGQYYCVVNFITNVVAVNQNGSLAWVYDGSQANLNSTFSPRAVCNDKYLNLLVSDCNNDCVHYLDREGQLIQVILTREQIGLVYHWGIGVDDETGQVWVGNTSGNLVVAKYLK